MTKPTDMSQPPRVPQLTMGAVAGDQTKTEESIGPLPGPGAIVQRLGQQFHLPRADIAGAVDHRSADPGMGEY